MKTESRFSIVHGCRPLKSSPIFFVLILFALCLGTVSCRPKRADETKPTSPAITSPDPMAFVLAPHAGDQPLDEEIRRFQEQLRSGGNRDLTLEQLGWAFVAKARESFDAGFYKLAEQCA